MTVSSSLAVLSLGLAVSVGCVAMFTPSSKCSFLLIPCFAALRRQRTRLTARESRCFMDCCAAQERDTRPDSTQLCLFIWPCAREYPSAADRADLTARPVSICQRRCLPRSVLQPGAPLPANCRQRR